MNNSEMNCCVSLQMNDKKQSKFKKLYVKYLKNIFEQPNKVSIWEEKLRL